MKKFLILIGLLLITSNSYAANARNVYASWATITSTATTFTFPYRSKDIYINNQDSSNAVCVNLKEGIPTPACDQTTARNVFLAAGKTIDLLDYEVDSIAIVATAASASPVTVIVDY